MNYFGFLKNILWLNNLTENCANSPKTETDSTWGEKNGRERALILAIAGCLDG